nr:MAG TPA: hypothetical protein [Caudoviricetes sp.]
MTGPVRHPPPIKIKARSFLPDTLPSALYPARHQPCFQRNVSLLPSFRLRIIRLIFAGNTYKYRANESRMELAPIMPSAADIQLC